MAELDWDSVQNFIVSWKREGDDKVIDFVSPEDLEVKMTSLIHHGIIVKDPVSNGAEDTQPSSSECKDIQDLADMAMRRSVQSTHPLFVNQLYGGVHPAGLAASYIIEKMNANAHTYEAAPVFVLAERIVLKELRKLFFGSDVGDGIFAPGGSMANMYAFTLARHKKFPDVKENGLFGIPPLVFFTSTDAHYSVSKAANWMGIGISNVIKVATNKLGQMEPQALKEAIRRTKSEGKVPLVVNATAGTTVLGAFDNINLLSEICSEEGIWLHLDAAWGGSFIFSETLRARYLKGVEKCDSIAWNAHKMLGAPLQCSAFITRQENCLEECNSSNATYLFQPDKFYSIEYDRGGDKSFQCGRKADGFKLWFMWCTVGPQGFKNMVEIAEDSARYFSDLIKDRDDFIVYLGEHQCTNVFFWIIPPSLRGHRKVDQWWKRLADTQVKLKERMVLEGSMMLGYSPLPHKSVPNALRLVLPAWPLKTHQHMDIILDNIIQLAKDL